MTTLLGTLGRVYYILYCIMHVAAMAASQHPQHLNRRETSCTFLKFLLLRIVTKASLSSLSLSARAKMQGWWWCWLLLLLSIITQIHKSGVLRMFISSLIGFAFSIYTTQLGETCLVWCFFYETRQKKIQQWFIINWIWNLQIWGSLKRWWRENWNWSEGERVVTWK